MEASGIFFKEREGSKRKVLVYKTRMRTFLLSNYFVIDVVVNEEGFCDCK